VALGTLGHVLVSPQPDVAVVGASDGISALLVLAGLAFPKARLRFFVFHRWLSLRGAPPWRWFSVEVRVVLLIWVMSQALGACRQAAGLTRVSSAAHLGGALAGVIVWWFWRYEGRPGRGPGRS
jgi:membrane associated rhomboid family serine protease